MRWRLWWWFQMLVNPRFRDMIKSMDEPDPMPPTGWGEDWHYGLHARKLDGVTSEEEAMRRWQWAKSAGLVEQRFDEHNNSFIRKNDPDWWDKAGEALALLRGETLPTGGAPDETS